MVPDDDDRLGWWAIAGTELLALLHRVATGEDPDVVYAEAYANAEHPDPERKEPHPPMQ